MAYDDAEEALARAQLALTTYLTDSDALHVDLRAREAVHRAEVEAAKAFHDAQDRLHSAKMLANQAAMYERAAIDRKTMALEREREAAKLESTEQQRIKTMQQHAKSKAIHDKALAIKNGKNLGRLEFRRQSEEAARKTQAPSSRGELQQHDAAAAHIQKHQRSKRDREVAKRHRAARKIQAAQRGLQERTAMVTKHEAARQMQALRRGKVGRTEIASKHYAASRIQAVHRGREGRKDLTGRHRAVTQIQAVQRGRKVRSTTIVAGCENDGPCGLSKTEIRVRTASMTAAQRTAFIDAFTEEKVRLQRAQDKKEAMENAQREQDATKNLATKLKREAETRKYATRLRQMDRSKIEDRRRQKEEQLYRSRFSTGRQWTTAEVQAMQAAPQQPPSAPVEASSRGSVQANKQHVARIYSAPQRRRRVVGGSSPHGAQQQVWGFEVKSLSMYSMHHARYCLATGNSLCCYPQQHRGTPRQPSPANGIQHLHVPQPPSAGARSSSTPMVWHAADAASSYDPAAAAVAAASAAARGEQQQVRALYFLYM